MAKQDLLRDARVAAKALYLGAISDGAFVVCVRNTLLRQLSQTWQGEREDRDLLRIQHDALATLDELASDIQNATSEQEAVETVERLGWWHDNAFLTGVRVAALKDLVENEEVYYYGPDFRITKSDVDEAIKEAEELVGVRWSGLMEAEPWEDR